jgi:hypothetical protein
MQITTLFKCQVEFRNWVLAYSTVENVNCDPDTLLKRLTDRIPKDRQMHIGAALLNNWIETENKPNRGYFVRESDRPGNLGNLPTITHYGNSNHAPRRKLFVQLSGIVAVWTY